MKHSSEAKKPRIAERFAFTAMQMTGSTSAIIIAFALVILWGIAGPIFHFSENWLLAINTFTSLVTFLMVFMIQKAHNKDSLAIQLKLNELLATHEPASNKLLNAEHMPEEELKIIQQDYSRLREEEDKPPPTEDGNSGSDFA